MLAQEPRLRADARWMDSFLWFEIISAKTVSQKLRFIAKSESNYRVGIALRKSGTSCWWKTGSFWLASNSSLRSAHLETIITTARRKLSGAHATCGRRIEKGLSNRLLGLGW